MEIENACFYLIRLHDAESVVFTLADSMSQNLRFIRHMCAGPEESIDCKSAPVLKRLGMSHEIVRDEYAMQVMTILVKLQIDLDSLEFLQLLHTLRSNSVQVNELKKISDAVQHLKVERERIQVARNRLWHNFSHPAAI